MKKYVFYFVEKTKWNVWPTPKGMVNTETSNTVGYHHCQVLCSAHNCRRCTSTRPAGSGCVYTGVPSQTCGMYYAVALRGYDITG